MKRVLSCLLAVLPLSAQAPPDWNQGRALGSDLAPEASWYGAGLWAADQHGPPATLIDSLGMGNAVTGHGVSVEAGVNSGPWSFALKGLANSDPKGEARFLLYRGHATYRSARGWLAGFEEEPLVWGFGLNGGYLLGEAARPIPKFRLESPTAQRSLFGVPLGQWGVQWFLGRLPGGTQVPDNAQMPAFTTQVLAAEGTPTAPLLSGYRIQATFLDQRVEFYLNWIVLWAGNRNGQPVTAGYTAKEYLTALTGTKDPLTETNTNWNDPNHAAPTPVNGAQSSTNFDTGVRVRSLMLARAAGAERAWFYLSRGTKGMTINWGTFIHKPVYYLGQDVSTDGRFLLQGHPGMFWNNNTRYLMPNLYVPNDTVGLLFQWPGVRFGLEYQSTVNPADVSYRPFVNGSYPGGFYTQGDPLGEANGGEAYTTTARLELDLSRRLASTTTVLSGTRPFRDAQAFWAEAHPGASAFTNHVVGLQQTVDWKPESHTTLKVGASWQRSSAVDFVRGDAGNGVRWFADLAFRWTRTGPGQP